MMTREAVKVSGVELRPTLNGRRAAKGLGRRYWGGGGGQQAIAAGA